ncbi:MAG TPA: IclR family transcriptional regulator [Chthoniobacteraceae bacterium]|nr:IclR family transcriptional regulator [Chthoniobacteraceae bacterium]
MNVSSVEKAFGLLEHLADAGRPLSLNEITQAAQLPKPTAYRLLRSLHELGYVGRPLGSRDYALGPRAARLAGLIGKGDPYGALKAAARPLLEKLHEQLDETVNLGVLSGRSVHYLDFVETTQPLRYIVIPSDRDPYHATALGRAIVSQLDPATQEAMLAATPFKGKGAPAEPEALRGLLARARRNGYAEEVEEAVPGVACLAVSLAPRGFSEAAISVAVPVQRFDAPQRQAMLDALLAMAQP